MNIKNNNFIEYVKDKNNVLAIIVRESFSKKGIEFFTPDTYGQQVGYMRRPKGYCIKPHIHYQIPRTVSTLQEVLLIKKGKVRRAKLYYLRNLKGKAARIKEKE